MKDREILEQLLKAEELVVQAAEIIRKVQVESAKRTEVPAGYPINHNAVIRRDDSDCRDIFNRLFPLVEPYVLDKREDLNLEAVRNPSYNGKSFDDVFPRGDLSTFRYRYEILCGVRGTVQNGTFWDGTRDNRYPRVSPFTGKPIGG